MSYIKASLRVFYRYRYLLANLVSRDFKVKYRRSILGVIWSILNPLLMMIVLTAVFSKIFRFEIPNFPVYLLTGQLIFNFFNDATTAAMGSILNSAGLIRKVYIPKYIFPLEKVSFNFINALFSLSALVLVMVFTKTAVTPVIALFWLPLLLLFFFNLGCGLILSSLVVFFRDIMHFYSVIILMLTYATPIFYPVEILPEYMKSIIIINPMYWYVAMFREIVLYGNLPTINQLIATILCAFIAMILGLIIFKKTQDRFILYV